MMKNEKEEKKKKKTLSVESSRDQ
uniref:Uncharacterized protein n=1 Tax=Caenorhabditis japonica TaxID=281687 RepID=A0A8R1EDX3_CAEJA